MKNKKGHRAIEKGYEIRDNLSKSIFKAFISSDLYEVAFRGAKPTKELIKKYPQLSKLKS